MAQETLAADGDPRLWETRAEKHRARRAGPEWQRRRRLGFALEKYIRRRTPMKKLGLIVVMLMIAATVSFGKKADKTYAGEIMDSQCSKMGNHDAGYKLTGTNTPKDCALACVKAGGKFILYDATAKTAYELDDQDRAKDLAGQKVKVEGTLNSSTKTIHVDKIQAAP
jgi:hypothetical protein